MLEKKENLEYPKVLKKLYEYDVITFDVFDTLVTRCVYSPSNVYSIVEGIANNQYGITRDVCHDRELALQISTFRFKEKNSINLVYSTLESEFHYSRYECDCLKKIEMETELALSIPRETMRRLLIELKNAGKQIILCCDTYFSSAFLTKILSNCGYPDDLEIWVSNEKAASKETGSLWKMLSEKVGARSWIHIGDDEWSDYQILVQDGKNAVLIDSGLKAFEKTEMYHYLSMHISGKIGDALVLGYLVNYACFNSPFHGETSEKGVVSIWMGAVFACFIDWLIQNADDSILLFVTREGYLLQRLYLSYCSALGVSTQKNSLFFASRSATLAATAISKESIRQITLFEYEGSFAHFLSTRLNYEIPKELEVGENRITLPHDSKRVLKLLEPYLDEIILNGTLQNDAYKSYVDAICKGKDEKLTIVDVGYSGTIQYALASILSKKVGGLYLFLNEKKVYRKAGCTAKSFRKATVGICPIYNNLLFLEAAMQAPHGQLQRMKKVNDEIVPEFNEDVNCSEFIPVAQSYYCEFVEWIGEWKKRIGNDFDLNFELAEKIWMCLLKFNLLPMALQDSFWLADDFAGNPIWRYDSTAQQWCSNRNKVPLRFLLLKEEEQPGTVEMVKLFVKKFIPDWAYGQARYLWRLCSKERKGRG